MINPSTGARRGYAMAKQISQDTFDVAVKENIAEFEMDPEEALNDAVHQFEAQVS